MRIVNRLAERIAVVAFSFVVGGLIGGGMFVAWAYNAAIPQGPLEEAAGQWVNAQTREDLNRHLKTAVVGGGAVAATFTFALLLRRDLGVHEME